MKIIAGMDFVREYNRIYARLAPRVRHRLERRLASRLRSVSPIQKFFHSAALRFYTWRITRALVRRKLKWYYDPYVLHHG